MSSQLKPQYARPNARLGELSANGKTIEIPSHLVSLRKPSDIETTLETINHLTSIGESPALPNTGGFVVELQSAKKLLSDQISEYYGPGEQVSLNDQEGWTDLYSAIRDLNKLLVVDPNTDRIFYSNYRDEFQEVPGLPDGFSHAIEKRLDDDDDEITGPTSGYKYLRDSPWRSILCEAILSNQWALNADFLIPPYYPIEKSTIGSGERQDIWGPDHREEGAIDTIPENMQLFNLAQELAARLYDRPLSAVIPLKTDILRESPNKGPDGLEPPEIWIDIMEEYSNVECEAYFIKATNASIEPGTLKKAECDGIVNFVKLFRKEYTDKPILFLGIDELAYVLMAHGLDVYSHPIYDSPYEKGAFYNEEARPDPADINYHRKFFVPRSGVLKKFDELENLGCDCPFCEPFRDVDPASIRKGKQDDLRKKHWLWVKDESIRQLKDSIRGDRVRPALRDFFTDSDWEKNYIKYLK